jgi:anti-sigma regulatory factor (Ser/Thr protein kinase)
MATLTVPNRVEFVRPATTFLVNAAKALAVPAANEPVFEIAVSEAITNAVKHGARGGANATITCELELGNRTLTLRIIDGGQGFRMPVVQLPEISREHIEAVPSSGYGLPIIHSVFPKVRVIEVQGRFGVELGLSY